MIYVLAPFALIAVFVLRGSDADEPVRASPSKAAAAKRVGEPLTPESFEALSGLHFGFRASDVSEAELASLPQSFPDGQPGDMTMQEPAGGYRDEIGIVTRSAARWAITFDKRAEANMIANAKSSKWFPIHLDDPVHGGPVRFDLNPHKSVVNSSTGDIAVKPDPVGNRAIIVDAAHEPHFLYFYALLMRERGNEAEFRWAVQEMKYWCAWNYLHMPDTGRGYGKGIFSPFATQVRAAAWSLCALFQLFHVLPKDDPWYPSVKYAVEQNILFLDGNFRLGTYDNSANKPYYDIPKGSLKNKLGLLVAREREYGGGRDGKQVMIAGFQAGFMAQVVLFGYRLNFDLNDEAGTAYKNLATFTARWPVMLFGPANTSGAYDWRRAGEYAMSVGVVRADDTSNMFEDGGAVYAANYGSFPPLAEDKAFRDHDQDRFAESIATSFLDSILPALGMAVDLGAEGASAAFARAESSTLWHAGGAYQFSMLPRGKFYRPAPKGAVTPQR